MKRPKPQTPACDKCSVGVMDATNQHLWGECLCECHSLAESNPNGQPHLIERVSL